MAWGLSAHRLQPQRGLASCHAWALRGSLRHLGAFSSEILEKLDRNSHHFLVSRSLSVGKSRFQSVGLTQRTFMGARETRVTLQLATAALAQSPSNTVI